MLGATLRAEHTLYLTASQQHAESSHWETEVPSTLFKATQ